jgi:hypothetical protein
MFYRLKSLLKVCQQCEIEKTNSNMLINVYCSFPKNHQEDLLSQMGMPYSSTQTAVKKLGLNPHHILVMQELKGKEKKRKRKKKERKKKRGGGAVLLSLVCHLYRFEWN